MLVLGLGSFAGTQYMKAANLWASPTFGQFEFGAAVSLACGHGFGEPQVVPPSMRAFLALQTDTFNCADLPAGPSTVTPNITQRLYRYLQTAVALQWKWSGVSWSALAPLFGLIFGLTLLGSYALFRLIANRIASVIMCVPLLVSAHQLGNLPGLRDYAKAPFMLGLFFVMALMALPGSRPSRNVILATVFGLLMGVGFGFRNDLLINVPPFILVVLLWPGSWRDQLRTKALCLAVALVAFLIVAWPILGAYGQGSNSGHVAVLGWTSAFDGSLGLSRPAYDLGSHYLDGFSAMLVNGHSVLTTGHPVVYLSGDYERTAASLLSTLVWNWPADVVARGTAAALQIFNFPFTVGLYSVETPPGLTAPTLLGFYSAQQTVLRWMTGLGLPIIAIAMLIIGSRSPRAGAMTVLLSLFYCGYPAVQFHPRHYFHLEFIAWWSLLFVAVSGAGALGLARRDWRRLVPTLRQGLGVATVIVVALIATAAPLAAARAYQQRHVPTIINRYVEADRTPLTTTLQPATNGRTLLEIDGVWPSAPTGAVELRYLVAEFGGCQATDLPVTITYRAINQLNDYSFLTRLRLAPAAASTLVVPVFRNAALSQFVGLTVPQGHDGCLQHVGAVRDVSTLPLPLTLTLPPSWQSQPLYQQIQGWDQPSADREIVVTAPPDLALDRSSSGLSLTTDFLAVGVSESAAPAISGRVIAASPQMRLVRFSPTPQPAGARLLVRGRVIRGGLRIGMLKDDLWFGNAVTIPERGAFTAILRASEAGTLGAMVADQAAVAWRMEPRALLRRGVYQMWPSLLIDEFEITRAEWLTDGDR